MAGTAGTARDQRLPNDKDRISRHYYDVAVITATDVGHSALSNIALLDAVRNTTSSPSRRPGSDSRRPFRGQLDSSPRLNCSQ